MTADSNSENWMKDYLLLSIILLLYGINIYYLTNLDHEPPKWDESVHLRDSLVFYNVLSDPSQINLEIIEEIINKSERYPLLRPSGYYPPFAPMLTSISYFIFGISPKVAIMSNMIFLLILVFSTYGIGTLLFYRKIGLLASVLILLFPMVLSNSVVYMLDLSLTAMVSLGIYTLIRTEYFKNTSFSMISGIVFGLGMLTKWTFLFFLLGPLCYFLIAAFYSENSPDNTSKNMWKPIRNIILFVIASVCTCGPYYFPILPNLVEETLKYSHGVLGLAPDSRFSLASILFYPFALWKDMITPFGFIVLAIGIVTLSSSKSRYKAFLLVWIIIPYLIFTFIIQIKQPRYMMPLLVPISLIISFAICKFESFNIIETHTKIKNLTIPLFLAIFVLYFLIDTITLRNSIINNSREDWKIAPIVSVIENDIKEGNNIRFTSNKPKYLGVIPDHQYINGQTLRYYATLRGLPINVIKLQNYRGTALEEFFGKFDRYDYILTKNHSNVPVDSFQKSIDDMHDFFYSRKNQFEHLKTFQEPDGSEVSIFKRRKGRS